MDEFQGAEFAAQVGWTSQRWEAWEGFGNSRVNTLLYGSSSLTLRQGNCLCDCNCVLFFTEHL